MGLSELFKALVLTVFSFGIISYNLSAQNVVQHTGTVRDIETLEIIPFANIQSTSSGTSTDAKGRFIIETYLGDSLLVTHVNYKPLLIPLGKIIKDSLNLYLIPKNTVLNEVKIFGMPSEERFKYNILQTKVKIPLVISNANRNFDFAELIFKSGYPSPPMDGEENYQNYIQSPKAVNLLGIFDVFRNLGKDNNPYLKLPKRELKEDSLWIKYYKYKNPFNY